MKPGYYRLSGEALDKSEFLLVGKIVRILNEKDALIFDGVEWLVWPMFDTDIYDPLSPEESLLYRMGE